MKWLGLRLVYSMVVVNVSGARVYISASVCVKTERREDRGT